MAIIKVKGWPKVQPDDDGIRPAGPPDACFYCRSKVGEPHEETCVCVMSHVVYIVYGNMAKKGQPERWVSVGLLKMYEPWYWNVEQCEFARNQSTWCADNALDQIDWVDDIGKYPEIFDFKQRLEMLPEDACSCWMLKFEFHETLDNGPFIQEPMKHERGCGDEG